MTVTVTGEKGQNNPSSNCFVIKPNDFLSFEPYYRVETGGGYNFADYLNPVSYTHLDVYKRQLSVCSLYVFSN